MLKISYAASPCLSQFISAQFAPGMCHGAQNHHKKIHKNSYFGVQSSKVIEFGDNRESVYDFLLVINSNLGPISHRYWDTATYWLKIANFSYPSHFSTLVRGDLTDLRQIYGIYNIVNLRFCNMAHPNSKTEKVFSPSQWHHWLKRLSPAMKPLPLLVSSLTLSSISVPTVFPFP